MFKTIKNIFNRQQVQLPTLDELNTISICLHLVETEGNPDVAEMQELAIKAVDRLHLGVLQERPVSSLNDTERQLMNLLLEQKQC